MPTNHHQAPKGRRRRRHNSSRIPGALRRQRLPRPRLRLSLKTARRIAELDAALETAAGSSVAEVTLGDLIAALISDATSGFQIENILSGWDWQDPAKAEAALKRLARRWAEENGQEREERH
ncbi:MAG: hypothetical protein EOP86_27815 [Verrucomicrobiaceae bacterium]|nr:MAG: hypothetical protein EOP86_27815 [Verrucomicrobiaceae bacterium]